MANALCLASLTSIMNGNYNQRVPMGAYGQFLLPSIVDIANQTWQA